MFISAFLDVHKHHGGHVVNTYYGGSLSKALNAIYPDAHLLPWMFRVTPLGFWKSFENRLVRLHYAMKPFHFSFPFLGFL